MLDSLTYKQRNLLLVPLVLILLWASYHFALSKTIELFVQVSQLEHQMEASSPQRLAKLKLKLRKLNAQMNNYKFDDTRNKEFILGITSEFCSRNKITLSEFPEAAIVESESNTLETLTITAQGTFKGLLQLLHFLEHQHSVGRICAVKYYTQYDHKNQFTRLYAKIYIQNIRTKEKQ